jgi:hypothetical protein
MGPTFWSKEETFAFLMEDADGYVRSMTEPDLRARHTDRMYKDRAARSAEDFTARERQTLTRAAGRVDRTLSRHPDKRHLGIDLGALARIPWVFAKTQGRTYENGLPHTRAGAIFLTSETASRPDIDALLLHEKVHVYQRRHPDAMRRYLEKHGVVPTARARDLPRVRANPDEDGLVYTDPEGRLLGSFYASDTPANLTDLQGQTRHPFESVAYAFERMTRGHR